MEKKNSYYLQIKKKGKQTNVGIYWIGIQNFHCKVKLVTHPIIDYSFSRFLVKRVMQTTYEYVNVNA